jgi:phosphoserine aminotransferase
MQRPYNFSAGPAAIPAEVLEQAAAEMLNWHGSGMGVMEMSHRGKEFISIYEQAEADLRELLAVPAHFKILFMQGGGLAENAIVPLNLSRAATVDFVVTGSWSQKSQKEARKYAAEVNVIASGEDQGFTTLPDPAQWRPSKGASYLHICSNETINGVEFHELPDLRALGCDAPLVVDFSSHVASRPGRLVACWLGFWRSTEEPGTRRASPWWWCAKTCWARPCPPAPAPSTIKTVADNQSMYNTPPTWGIYMAGPDLPLAQAPDAKAIAAACGRDGAAQHRQGRTAVRHHRQLAALLQQGGSPTAARA